MIAYSARARGYLLAFSVLLALTGTVFFLSRGRLPYGHAAPEVLIGALVLSIASTSIWFRQRRLRGLLTRSESFELPPRAIPAREESTYIGRGFPWKPLHTERLGELLLSDPDLPDEARDRLGGNWLIQGVGGDARRDLFLPDPLLTQHLLVLGAPGSGKSRFLELLIEQAVARGDAVVVVDPKGDERLLDRTYDASVRAGRGDRFRFFALPFPYQSVRYNPLGQFVRPNEITSRIALILPRGGGDAEAFRNFAWDFVNTVTTALSILGEEITIDALQNYCLHNTWFLVRRLLKHYFHDIDASAETKDLLDRYRAITDEMGKGILELDQLIKMASLDKKYFDKISSALRPVFSKLMSDPVGYLLCPGRPTKDEEAEHGPPVPEISWDSIDEQRQVVYFFLGSMIGPDTASGVARMALADLQSYIGKKYAYREAVSYGRITVIVDEAGDVLAPETVNILNKARGAELSLSLAVQSLADFDVALRGGADARRALANLATFIALRTQNPEDARFFSDKCGRRLLRVVSESEAYEPALFSSARKNIDDFAFRSARTTSTRQEPLVPEYVLAQLPRFHFMAHHSGDVWKGELPFLDAPGKLYSTRLKGADA